MQNEDFLPSKIDIRNQPAFVVADIKNHARPDPIDIPPTLFYVREVAPLRRLDDSVPRS
jgi:hypothetical protein